MRSSSVVVPARFFLSRSDELIREMGDLRTKIYKLDGAEFSGEFGPHSFQGCRNLSV